MVFVLLVFLKLPALNAQNASFHNAPASADQVKNPYAGQPRASEIGGQLYAANCAACHGRQGEGAGNIPALKSDAVQATNEGELFWFITQGNVNNGMPSWASMSEERRWQIISYLKAGLPSIPRNANSF
jgi:mono/diheme cytochrome c family protein